MGEEGLLTSSAVGGKVVLGGREFVVDLEVVKCFLEKVVKNVVGLGSWVNGTVVLPQLKSSHAIIFPLPLQYNP